MSLVQYIHNQLQRWAISQRLFDFNISQRRGSNGWKMLVRLMSEPSFEFWAGKMSHILWSQLAAIVLISSKKRQPWLFEERRSATKTAMQTQVVSCWHVDVPIRDKRSRQHWDWDSWPTLELARLTSKHYDTQAPMISAKSSLGGSFLVPHIQKSKTPSHCTHASVFVFWKFHLVLFCMCGDGEGFKIHPFIKLWLSCGVQNLTRDTKSCELVEPVCAIFPPIFANSQSKRVFYAYRGRKYNHANSYVSCMFGNKPYWIVGPSCEFH